MSDLHQAVQAEIAAHTPARPPSFDALKGRKRSRDRRRTAAAVAASALAVAAVATVPAATGIGGDDRARPTATGAGPDDDAQNPYAERLLALADQAAKRNGGEAKFVEALRTTRRAAEGLSGSSSNQPDVAVWVVQVSGTQYSCDSCSVPYGAGPPRGRYLTFVPTVDTYEWTSFSISPYPRELAGLGPVEVLRDER